MVLLKRFPVICLLAGFLGGCSNTSELDAERELGEAYVAPMSMPLYNELSARPKVVGTVQHGQKLTIVAKRRRFLKVRAPDGKAGWTDSRQLLKEEGIDALRNLAKLAAKAPSFGEAMVYEPLNVHIQPNRHAPSFIQVQPNTRVDIVDYQLLERRPYEYPEILPPPPKVEPQSKRKKKRPEGAIPPPEPPDPPALPPNWMELSRSAQLEEQSEPAPESPKTPAPVLEGWSLIRTRDGHAGWALTRLLTMAIPDDVAQYSERQRITSYVALGFVEDEGQKRGIWLWTTLSDTKAPCHFDGFRLFTYSVRRHRYETSYREYNVRGFLPIEARPTANAIGSSFSLLLMTGTGLVKRDFSFNGYRVQVTGETPAERKKNEFLTPHEEPAEGASSDKASIKEEIKGKLKNLLK